MSRIAPSLVATTAADPQSNPLAGTGSAALISFSVTTVGIGGDVRPAATSRVSGERRSWRAAICDEAAFPSLSYEPK